MMKSYAAATICALFAFTGCNRAPSTTPAASFAAQDELRPIGTTGTMATTGTALTPPAGFELVNLRNGPSYVNCGADRHPVVRHRSSCV